MNSSKEDRVRLMLVVSGRVQGVFFRASAADYARKLGVTGYVRNLRDGTVEILAEGSRVNLRHLETWAHQGPEYAQVDGVISEWDDSRNEFDSFRIA